MALPELYAPKGFFAPRKELQPMPEVTQEVGFVEGLKHSALGVAIRENLELGETAQYTWKPSEEEFNKVYDAVGGNEVAVKHILSRANSAEDLDKLTEIHYSERAYAHAEATAGTCDSFFSGVGKALGNPVDIATIPITGGASFGARVLIGAGLSGLSAYAEEAFTGLEQDVTAQSLAGGAIIGALAGATKFTAGLRGTSDEVAKVAYKSDFINNTIYKAGSNTREAVSKVSTALWKELPEGTQQSISETIQKLKDLNLGVSLLGSKHSILKTDISKDMVDKLCRDQAGRTIEGKTIKAQVGNELVGEEIIQQSNEELRLLQNRFQDVGRFCKAQNISYENLRGAIYEAIEGHLPTDSSFWKIEGFKELVSEAQQEYAKIITRLRNAGIPVREFSPNYMSWIGDRNRIIKVANALKNKLGLKDSNASFKALRSKVKNLLMKTLDDPESRKRLKEFLEKEEGRELSEEEFVKLASEKATKDAYGYVDQNRSAVSPDGNEKQLFTTDYTRERTPWNHSIKDEDGFSVNDLRIDPLQAIGAYSRRATGDYIAVKLYGVNPAVLLDDTLGGGSLRLELNKKFQTIAKAEANTMSPNLRDSHEKAVMRVLKTVERGIYQTTDRDLDSASGGLSALCDVIRNLSFFTSNAFMGLLNLTEQAEAIKAYGASFMLKSLPVISKKFSSWSKGDFTPQERRSFMNLVFGHEVRGYRIWDETYQRTAFKYGDGSIATALVAGTAQLSEWSPFTRFLNATQESIAKTAQDEFLGEYLRHIFSKSPTALAKKGGYYGKGFLNEETLTRAGVTKEDFDYLSDVLRNCFEQNSDGSFRVIQKNMPLLVSNDRALFTIRRLGNYVSSEVIQKNSLGNTMLWQGSNASPVLSLMFQFKTFALASYQNRLMKSVNRAKEGDIAGQIETHTLSAMLAGLGVIAQSSVKTSGMNKKEREKWWERNFGVKSLEDVGKTEGSSFRFFMNALNRSGMYASMSLFLSPIFGQDLKSTTKGYVRPEDRVVGLENIIDLFPSARVITNVASLPQNLYYASPLSDDKESLKKKHAKAGVRNFLGILPPIDPLKNQLKGVLYDYVDEQYKNK